MQALPQKTSNKFEPPITPQSGARTPYGVPTDKLPATSLWGHDTPHFRKPPINPKSGLLHYGLYAAVQQPLLQLFLFYLCEKLFYLILRNFLVKLYLHCLQSQFIAFSFQAAPYFICKDAIIKT